MRRVPLLSAQETPLAMIDARIPASKGRNTTDRREGISFEALARLLEIIKRRRNLPERPQRRLLERFCPVNRVTIRA
jgi:hypothetical protein